MKKKLAILIYILIGVCYSCTKEYSGPLNNCKTAYWELAEKGDTTYQMGPYKGYFGNSCNSHYDTTWQLICTGPGMGRWIYR